MHEQQFICDLARIHGSVQACKRCYASDSSAYRYSVWCLWVFKQVQKIPLLWSSVCLFYLAPNCFTSHWPVLFCWLPGFLPWLMFVVWGEQGYEQNEETFVKSHVLQLSVYVSGVNSERVSSSIIHTNLLEVLKHDPWQTHHCPPVNILVFGWSVCGLVCKILLLVSAIIWQVDYWNFVSLILHNPLFPLFHSFSSY